MKKINLFLVYLVSFLFMEFLFKILAIHHFSLSIINMLFFLIAFSLILSIITTLSNKKGLNKTIFIVIMVIIAIWFSASYVIKTYFNFTLSLSDLKLADQVGEFASKGVVETLKRLPGIIGFFIPLIISLIFQKRISFKQENIKKCLVAFSLSLAFFGFFILSLNINKNEPNSVYSLYYQINDVSLNEENFGVIDTFLIDIKRMIFGFKEKIDVNNNLNHNSDDTNKEITYDYNNLDIDFSALEANESNKTIQSMHEYFKNDSGTLQNEYTGIFKDKNLILFMAESFNEIAVSKDLTPTLYKLVNNGFTFTNFYTPTIYSTIGGEFQELTGLYAQSTSILSKFRSGNITFPQGIGTKFSETGYKTFAYHNNSYRFQDRNKYLESLGFTNFKACYNGLEKLINCSEWPQSDVAMIDATINDYINEDKFMVFYASVSGHSTYTFAANAQARKHRSEYESFNLPYSEGPASYLSAQMELDRALEDLINKLKEAGKLDDTVIALVGDHYPYELSIDEVNEVSTFKRDDKVTVNKSNFILWNNKMDNVKVTKVGSQIDVMPTIYNTFGIKYDSRLFIGKDILSTEGGLAMFADRSWVTDKGIYYASRREFVPNEGVEVEEGYVSSINQIVNSKITMSKNIIDTNYYSKVFN